MRPPAPRTVITGFVWASLALAPLVISNWHLSQLTLFFTYGLFAMSLSLIWGHCGMLCFGQALFFGVGAYAMSLVTLGMVPGLEGIPSSYLGFFLAIATPAVAANLLGRFLFYGRGLQGAYFGIVTLAIAIIAERLAVNWSYIGGLNGLMNVPPVNLGLRGDGFEIWDALPVYYLTLTVAVAVYFLLEAFIRSRYGIVLRAIRDNQERTAFFGYDTTSYKITAFTLSAAVAGLAGALFVTQFSFASPPLIGFGLSTEVLIWVAMGGRTILLAAFLGALVVRGLEGILSELLGPYWLLALGALFVLTVIFFPRGLIGEVFFQLERLFQRWKPKGTG